MPFLEQLVPGGPWVPKFDVALRQLPARESGFGSPVRFEVLETFRYARPGSPAAAGEEEPPAELAVCRGDVTDLASVPAPLWGVVASYGTHTMPALLHDRLCVQAARQPGQGPALRRWADRLFRRMLRDEAQAGIATRWAMWSAVRVFSFVPLAVAAVAWSGASWAAVVLLVRGVPLPRLLRVAVGGTSLGVVAVSLVRAVEGPLDLGTACAEPPAAAAAQRVGAEPLRRRFRLRAAGSLLGATGVGALSFPLFAPVALLNVAVLVVLRGLDVAFAVGTAIGLRPLARRRQRSRPPRWGVPGGPRPGLVDTVAGAVVDEPWPAIGRPFPRA